ncbi:hypothetical protein L0Y49_00385 [bacterium]|nr:hypothetical protein [bacterium]
MKEKVNIHPIIMSVAAAIGFGLWPILARLTGASPALIAFWVSAGILIPAFAYIRLTTSVPFHDMANMTNFALIGVGILNGISFVFYSDIIQRRDLDISLYIPLISVSACVVAVIGAYFLGERFTQDRITGLCLATGAIWFLSKSP